MKPLSGRDVQEVIRNTIEFLASQLPFAQPDLATIQSLKAHRDPLYQVHYITVKDVTGQLWHYKFLLAQKDGIWGAKTMDCGPGSPQEELDEPLELADCPWIRLTQLQMDNEFYAFGEVFDKGYRIVSVRLLDQGGLVLEDTVQDGIVLFYGEQEPIYPLQLELYNSSGTLVSRQKEMPGYPRSVTKEI